MTDRRWVLVLEQTPTPLGAGVAQACRARDVGVLHLTPERVAGELAIGLRIGERDGFSCELEWRGQAVSDHDLCGVFCGLDYFASYHFPGFSQRDAEYAALETHALWLAVLTGLSCPVINPPAPDALGGAVRSSSEVFALARGAGLATPAVVYLESGRIAAELAEQGVAATYCDLGGLHDVESPSAPGSAAGHVRARERAAGQRVSVCLFGDAVFAAALDPAAWRWTLRSPARVPSRILTQLRVLHGRLGLELGEYQFAVQADGAWILDDHQRTPGPEIVAAIGPGLVEQLAVRLTGQEPASW